MSGSFVSDATVGCRLLAVGGSLAQVGEGNGRCHNMQWLEFWTELPQSAGGASGCMFLAETVVDLHVETVTEGCWQRVDL